MPEPTSTPGHPEGWDTPAPKPGVETKVKVATAGGLATTFVVTLVSHMFFKDADLPSYVVSAIDAIVVSAGTFLSGFLAKHTPRF